MERRGSGRAPGPEDHQAAISMGHSVQAWDKWYDRYAFERDTQEGVNLMQDWRSQLLTSEFANLALPDMPSQDDEDAYVEIEEESDMSDAVDAD